MLIVFVSSISVVRIAGGTGVENEAEAWAVIHENLSEEVIDKSTHDDDPLADLLGDAPATDGPITAKLGDLEEEDDEDEPDSDDHYDRDIRKRSQSPMVQTPV